MERVAFLIEETGERVACLLNPESLVMRRTAGFRPRRSMGGSLSGTELADDVLIYTGGGMTEMFLDLLFDVSLMQMNREIKDVRDLTSPFWKLAENSGAAKTYGEPSRVRFVWGKSWNIPGVVAAVSENFDYFDAAGVPLRSWLRMRFLRVVEPLAESSAKAPPLAVTGETTPEQFAREIDKLTEAAGGEVKVHTFAAGERLDQLVREQYGFFGHPAMWRMIAAYNNVADPLAVAPGTILQFPPLSVLQEKK